MLQKDSIRYHRRVVFDVTVEECLMAQKCRTVYDVTVG